MLLQSLGPVTSCVRILSDHLILVVPVLSLFDIAVAGRTAVGNAP
jgi:hypothetical protein